jgi:hypothetical protein
MPVTAPTPVRGRPRRGPHPCDLARADRLPRPVIAAVIVGDQPDRARDEQREN